MANIKNFGIAGVSADVQMGKSGGRLVYDSGNTLFKFTTSSAPVGAASLIFASVVPSDSVNLNSVLPLS